MLQDAHNTFSDKQAITDTANSTNHINLNVAHDLAGGDIPLLIQVVEDFATLTSLEVQVQEATDAAFTSPDTIASTGAIALASLDAGYVFAISHVPKTSKQYVRLRYVVVGTTATAGKVTAALGTKAQTNR